MLCYIIRLGTPRPSLGIGWFLHFYGAAAVLAAGVASGGVAAPRARALDRLQATAPSGEDGRLRHLAKTAETDRRSGGDAVTAQHSDDDKHHWDDDLRVRRGHDHNNHGDDHQHHSDDDKHNRDDDHHVQTGRDHNSRCDDHKHHSDDDKLQPYRAETPSAAGGAPSPAVAAGLSTEELEDAHRKEVDTAKSSAALQGGRRCRIGGEARRSQASAGARRASGSAAPEPPSSAASRAGAPKGPRPSPALSGSFPPPDSADEGSTGDHQPPVGPPLAEPMV